MQTIPLTQIPSQSFSIQLDNSIYNMRIKFVLNFMIVDIVRDNQVIITGIRIVPGFPLIPFQYLEQGNFILTTFDNEYPNYTQFGVSQFLIYASPLELEAARAAAARF